MPDSAMSGRPEAARDARRGALGGAVETVTRTITVAAGVFGPGHLGELTRQVPFELVDAVLEQTGTVQRRLRELPSRVGVYFVLALGLYPELGYQNVWKKLTRALAAGSASPSATALRNLRRRLGPAPMQALFEVLAGPAAQPSTPGVRFGRYRRGGLRRLHLDQGARHRREPVLARGQPVRPVIRR